MLIVFCYVLSKRHRIIYTQSNENNKVTYFTIQILFRQFCFQYSTYNPFRITQEMHFLAQLSGSI